VAMWAWPGRLARRLVEKMRGSLARITHNSQRLTYGLHKKNF